MIVFPRPFVFLDLETTGVNPERDRVVEMGFVGYYQGGRFTERRILVNPEIPIPPESTSVHGIRDEDVAGAPKFAELAQGLAPELSGCDFGGKGIKFDLRVLAAEFARAGVAWSPIGASIVDAMRLEQIGVPRTLADLYLKHLGRPLEGAHGALVDASASAEITFAQVAAFGLPTTPAELHALQWPDDVGLEGKFKFRDGVPVVNFGKHRDTPMRDVPRGYWTDFILSPRYDFSEETKTIARDAANGVFPRPPMKEVP